MLKIQKFKMNRASVNCYRYAFEHTLLSLKQFAKLTVINWITMERNIILNALVIHLLFKNEKDCKYYVQIIYFAKFIRLGLLYQSSLTTIFNAKNYSLMEVSQLFLSFFFFFFYALINVYNRINCY